MMKLSHHSGNNYRKFYQKLQFLGMGCLTMKYGWFLALAIGIIIGASVAYAGIVVYGLGNPAGVSADQVQQLRNQLFKEGIGFSAVVSKTYPGLGFIASDSSAGVFVRWNGNVQINQNVNVNGTLSNNLTNLGAVPSDLADYLKQHPYYVVARQVT